MGGNRGLHFENVVLSRWFLLSHLTRGCLLINGANSDEVVVLA
jgi:hypothetical protein